MPWGQIAGAIGGSLVSGLFSRSNARDANQFSEDMSSTSYQRAVADMRAAGINPILAAKLGGASSPSGAMAQTPDFGGAINSATTAALGYRNVDKQGRLLEAQTENTQQATEKIEQEIENLASQKQLTETQTIATQQLADKTWAEVTKIGYETTSIQQQNQMRSIILSTLDEYPELEIMHRYGQPAAALINSVTGIVGNALKAFMSK